MTRENIQELREMMGKATQRPWQVRTEHQGTQNEYWGVAYRDSDLTVFDDGSACSEYGQTCKSEDRDFIVAFVNSAPELLRLAEAGIKLREAIKEMGLDFDYRFHPSEYLMRWKKERDALLAEYDKAVSE